MNPATTCLNARPFKRARPWRDVELLESKCQACEGGAEPLDGAAVAELMGHIPDWSQAGASIERSWRMKGFAAVVSFVRDMADLAEDEGHHPDIHITNYRMLKVVLTTHAIGGLSTNDFILAAKIDRLWRNTHA